MISPMFIPSTQDNIVIEFGGSDYIAFPCLPSPGAAFFSYGYDITTSVSNIDHGKFTTDMVVNCDPTVCIVDDALNAYFKVDMYIGVSSTTRPTRI